jgi:hypothetical protein
LHVWATFVWFVSTADAQSLAAEALPDVFL